MPQSAEAEISFDVIMDAGFMAIEADNGPNLRDADFADQDPGFQTPTSDFYVRGEAIEGLDVFFKLTNDAQDWGGDVDVNWDWGYITFTDLSPAFDVQFGSIGVGARVPWRGKTDGPSGMKANPVIGNSPVEVSSAANGLKILGSTQRFSWSANVNTGHFFDNFTDGRGYGYGANVSFEVVPQLSLAASYGTMDADRPDPSLGPTPARGNNHSVWTPNADNEPYIFDNGAGGSGVGGGTPSQVDAAGIDVDSWEIGARWEPPAFPVYVIGFWGNYTDDLDGPGEREIDYYGAEGEYNLTPVFSIGARYVIAENESSGGSAIGSPTDHPLDNIFSPGQPVTSGNDELDRLQIGLNYEYTDKVLFKGEWVDQSEDSGANLSGINEDFDGFLVETVITF